MPGTNTPSKQLGFQGPNGCLAPFVVVVVVVDEGKGWKGRVRVQAAEAPKIGKRESVNAQSVVKFAFRLLHSYENTQSLEEYVLFLSGPEQPGSTSPSRPSSFIHGTIWPMCRSLDACAGDP